MLCSVSGSASSSFVSTGDQNDVSMTLIYTVRLNKKFLPFDRISAFHEATGQKFGATLQIRKDSLTKIARRIIRCDYFDYFAASAKERRTACGYIKNLDVGILTMGGQHDLHISSTSHLVQEKKKKG